MSKMSFIDKIGILFNVSVSSILHIVLLIGFLFLGFLYLTSDKKSKKRNKMIYIGCSVFILLFVIITYHSSLVNIFDYMMNNFFIAVYFPNLAIYLAAIITTNIILGVSLFRSKTSEIIRKINIIVYVIMHYLLFLILGVINKNNLDVFTQSSVYGNKKASALIELSSLLFIVWIIYLVLYKIILSYIKKDEKQKVKKVVVKEKERVLPENFIPVDTPKMIYSTMKKKEKNNTIIKPTTLTEFYSNNNNNNTITNQSIIIEEDNKKKEPIFMEDTMISNNGKEITDFDRMLLEQNAISFEEPKEIKEESVVEEKPTEMVPPYKQPVVIEAKKKTDPVVDKIEQSLTVDDYKLLLRMLKEQKEKDKLEEIRRQERAREQERFIELQALYGYGNVR